MIEFHVGPIQIPRTPVAVEVWAGTNVYVPPGAWVIPVSAIPQGWAFRLCIALTSGWWFLKKTMSFNIVFQKSAPVLAKAGEGSGDYSIYQV